MGLAPKESEMERKRIWITRDEDDSGPLVWGVAPEKHSHLGWSADTDLDRKALETLVRKGKCQEFILVPAKSRERKGGKV